MGWFFQESNSKRKNVSLKATHGDVTRRILLFDQPKPIISRIMLSTLTFCICFFWYIAINHDTPIFIKTYENIWNHTYRLNHDKSKINPQQSTWIIQRFLQILSWTKQDECQKNISRMVVRCCFTQSSPGFQLFYLGLSHYIPLNSVSYPFHEYLWISRDVHT